MQDFINELSNYLENNLDCKNGELPIIENILSKNKVTTGNENSIRWNLDEVLLKYAKQNFSNDIMYFVSDNKKIYWKNNKKYYNYDVYTILKVENNKIEEIEINKKNVPKDIRINDVFRIENNNYYIVDDIATKDVKEEITNMAKEIIDKQNANLNEYRKEGHLYLVREEIGKNRFLKDLNEDEKFEFEEVDIPKDLLDKVTEGSVLKFTNGRYEYYSSNELEI